MNAKRKAPKEQETGQDELTEDENARLAAEGEGMHGIDADNAQPGVDAGNRTAGVQADVYDPASPFSRPGQAPDRDDPTDTAYRASQGTGAGAASGTWKPAEPTPVMAGPDIPQIDLASAKPGFETVNSGRVPGAGDPQNGVVLTDWHDSPIAWVNPTWPTHQPNTGLTTPADMSATDDGTGQPVAETEDGAQTYGGDPREPGAPGKDYGEFHTLGTSQPANDDPPPGQPIPERPAADANQTPQDGDPAPSIYPPNPE